MARRAQFNLEDLADAGLSVVRGGGWDSVSVNSVANELSVSPMALYRLVPDATSLRRVIADAAADRLPVRSSGKDFVDDLTDWAKRAHECLRALPGLSGYVIHEWTELPGWLDIVDGLLQIAINQGLAGSYAVATTNAVFAFTLARVQLAETVRSRRTMGPLASHPDRFALIRANREEFRIAKVEDAFLFGLQALADGLKLVDPSVQSTSR